MPRYQASRAANLFLRSCATFRPETGSGGGRQAGQCNSRAYIRVGNTRPDSAPSKAQAGRVCAVVAVKDVAVLVAIQRIVFHRLFGGNVVDWGLLVPYFVSHIHLIVSYTSACRFLR